MAQQPLIKSKEQCDRNGSRFQRTEVRSCSFSLNQVNITELGKGEQLKEQMRLLNLCVNS